MGKKIKMVKIPKAVYSILVEGYNRNYPAPQTVVEDLEEAQEQAMAEDFVRSFPQVSPSSPDIMEAQTEEEDALVAHVRDWNHNSKICDLCAAEDMIQAPSFPDIMKTKTVGESAVVAHVRGLSHNTQICWLCDAEGRIDEMYQELTRTKETLENIISGTPIRTPR